MSNPSTSWPDKVFCTPSHLSLACSCLLSTSCCRPFSNVFPSVNPDSARECPQIKKVEADLIGLFLSGFYGELPYLEPSKRP
eukprot:2741526-Rhodomonas_salina.1